ncbi:MAG: hypothetical protein WDO16_03280 [Bacteroidota bacterium]
MIPTAVYSILNWVAALLLDLGIYPVFLALLLLGKPTMIKAIATLSDQGVEMRIVLFYFIMPMASMLYSNRSLLAQTETPAEIIGEKGSIRILHPWFEKTAGLEVHLFNDGKIVYPCQWSGHGLQFEAEEALQCIGNHKIASDSMPHYFSKMIMTVMDEIREQVHVT